jgi:hypothetical protein
MYSEKYLQSVEFKYMGDGALHNVELSGSYRSPCSLLR